MIVLILLALPQAVGKVDPETNRVRLVLFGEGWSVVPHIMMTDPKITTVVIPSGSGTFAAYMARFMRIYMPRTYQRWVGDVDVFMLSDLVCWGFTDEQLTWMRKSIEEEGTGMILSEMGWYSISDWTGNACEDWVKTVLYDAYPCDMVLGRYNRKSVYLDIAAEGPFTDLPGFDQVAFEGENGVHVARPGATTWAVYRIGREAAIVSRPYGKGMALANSMGIERFIQPLYEWKYHKDYFLNHAYLSAGLVISDDVEQVHRLRESLGLYQISRLMVRGVIDWAEKLGANVQAAENALGGVEETYGLALAQYLSGEYEESAQTLEQATKEANDALEVAYRIKRQAMLYIYLVEWTVTTGTLLLSGSVLYALMVRRRLYRAVETTKLLRAGEA